MEFQYEIIRETEKAIFAKVPYFERTCEYTKNHKQHYYECWIPKAVIKKGIAKQFVIGQRNEKRLKNAYQRLYPMPESWKTMGEIAPGKTPVLVETLDRDELERLTKFYENKYGDTLRRLIIDEEGPKGEVSDEDIKIIKHLEFPSLKNEFTPKKFITMYKTI